MKLSHLPLRAAVGAFVLNSGLAKRDLEGQSAESVHGMAAGAIPQVRQMPPQRFARLLSNTEVALGTALLMPAVPSALVGTGLAGFGAGLTRLYWKTPGMHEPGNPRPTQQGIGLAKDVWLLGAGLTLLLDDLLLRRRGMRRPAMRRAAGTRGRMMGAGKMMGAGMGARMMGRMPGRAMGGMRGRMMRTRAMRGLAMNGMMRGMTWRGRRRTGLMRYLPSAARSPRARMLMRG